MKDFKRELGNQLLNIEYAFLNRPPKDMILN